MTFLNRLYARLRELLAERGGLTDRDFKDAVKVARGHTGGKAKVLPNHHITKPVRIGQIQADGQFQVVWETPSVVPGEAWSHYLPESKDLIGDWTDPINCGNYNTKTKKCGGASK